MTCTGRAPHRDTVSAFLRTRRERITPEQAGLPAHGPRRVPGLRRGEVAALAGVSVEYYTRLERGSLKGASDRVLDALARALRLDPAERTYLYDLARAAGPASRAPAPPPADRSAVRPSVTRIIDAMPRLPACVINDRLDVLAANTLGRALYTQLFAGAAPGAANVARFAFLDPAARQFYLDWERMAGYAVGALRIEAGRHPCDRELTGLVGELSARSEDFRALWASHDVHTFRKGTDRFGHPVVGVLRLDQETMTLPDESGLSLVVYSAPAGSADEEGLHRLADWAAAAPARAGGPDV